MNGHEIGASLTLPCGQVVKNRILKSAMSETLGDREHGPKEGLSRLYGRWAEGGTGLLVTGNVMIDPTALGEPRNVVIEDDRHLAGLRGWAAAATGNGAQAWVQLNHPGKQSPKFLSPTPVAPSAISLHPSLSRFFAPPRELTDGEIREIVARFATAATVVKSAGFTGVQIHGAHGYLVSQFLSPLHNRRTDFWGGSAEARMQFVLAVYHAIREAVGPEFPIGIKLNSADFRTDGFSVADAVDVARALSDVGIDLVELSGGSYESPVMMAGKKGGEAYFLEAARTMKSAISAPVAVTGGFRTDAGMRAALEDGIDMVGVGRPLVVEPEFPDRILGGGFPCFRSRVRPKTTGIPAIDRVAMMEITWYEQQMLKMAKGKEPDPDENVWLSMARLAIVGGMQQFRRRRA